MLSELQEAKTYLTEIYGQNVPNGTYAVPTTTTRGDAFMAVDVFDMSLSNFKLFWDIDLKISWYGNPKPETIMSEVLDIIYTCEKGQSQMTLPISRLHEIGAFDSKENYESVLKLCWESVNFNRPPTNLLPSLRKLYKISTCIYSSSFTLPTWYGDWDGKFYYE